MSPFPTAKVITYPKKAVKSDCVAWEEPLEIWLKVYLTATQTEVHHLLTTMRTPGADEQLVRGWLIANDVIQMQDVLSITSMGTRNLRGMLSNRQMVTVKPGITVSLDRLQRAQISHSSCGVCGAQSIEWLTDTLTSISDQHRICFSSEQVLGFNQQISARQVGFKQTGSLHAAALIDETGNVIDVYEDVGRHNAMDKLLGDNYLRFPATYAVWLSGRVSFEIVQKALRLGISMIISVGAPTSLAIELCKEWNVALIGFTRPNQFNLYHGEQQINSHSGANGE